jgi:hypothetical protein
LHHLVKRDDTPFLIEVRTRRHGENKPT